MTPVEAFDRRSAFCARLKSERERRGMSLAAIAEVTKVKGSLLEALERGDLTRWPKGIYRRAFFREYVSAVGLPADLLVGEFLDLFTDREAIVTSVRPLADVTPASLRLTFAEPPGHAGQLAGRPELTPVPVRMSAATIDILAVAGLAGLVSLISPWTTTAVAVVVAPLYYLAVALLGQSPGLQAIMMGRRLLRSASTEVNTAAPALQPRDTTSSVAPAMLRDRVADVFRQRSLIREYVSRLSESGSLSLNRQRKQDLASVRRQRIEAASRPPVDEISGVPG